MAQVWQAQQPDVRLAVDSAVRIGQAYAITCATDDQARCADHCQIVPDVDRRNRIHTAAPRRGVTSEPGEPVGDTPVAAYQVRLVALRAIGSAHSIAEAIGLGSSAADRIATAAAGQPDQMHADAFTYEVDGCAGGSVEGEARRVGGEAGQIRAVDAGSLFQSPQNVATRPARPAPWTKTTLGLRT